MAAELARRGARVRVHGRDRARAAAADTGAVGVHVADFASLTGVRALAEALPQVDVLVNNAGVISQERHATEDGCELTFEVDHLAHFLLTLDVSGRYFEGTREAAADSFAYDAEARHRLWEASERLTGRA